MKDNLFYSLAKQLDNSHDKCKAIEMITAQHPMLTLHDAYQIQKAGIQLRLERGERITGYKMGLTSPAKQAQMHITTPIFGVLTNKMQLKDGDVMSLAQFIHPKVEPEIAFIIGKDLHGEISMEEALSACTGVCAALDILDSRYIDFKFTLMDVIADNCSAGAYVLGPIKNPADVDLGKLLMELKVNNETVEQGSSSDISGHPANSLVLLSQLLAKEKSYIKAGSVVLSGASTNAITLMPELHIVNQTESLGCVGFNVK